MPTVTVVLFTYNRTKYLRYAIEAILNQSYKDFEFLICDNGSTDETPEVVRSYTDHRIRYLRNEQNTREFVNIAFSESQGEYLLVTHDDDIMLKTFLEEEVKVLDNNKKIVAVGCNTNYINDRNEIIKENGYNIKIPILFKQYGYLQGYLNGYNLVMPTVLMRKSFFIDQNLYFDLSVGPGADNYLWIKASEHPVEIYIIPEVLFHYRVHNHQDSMMNSGIIENKLYDAILKLTEGREEYKKERAVIINKVLYENFDGYKKNKFSYKEYKRRLETVNMTSSDGTGLKIKILIFKLFPFLVKLKLA